MTANFLNLGKNFNSSVFNNLSNHIMTKQGQMFAFGKIVNDVSKLNDILKQSVTWTNLATKPIRDKRTGKVVKPRSIYAGKNGDKAPSWDLPVANIDKLSKAQEIIAIGETASTTEIDKALHDPYYPEFQEAAKYYNDVILESETAAGIMTSQDFPLINNVNVAGQVIIDQQTEFPLLNLVNVENTTELIFRRYKGVGFDIDAVVGELATTEPRKMSFTKEEFYTRKSGGEIQWSDEHEMQNYIISPLQIAQGQFQVAASKIKNEKILKALAGLNTSITGAVVDTYTSDHSTNNPLDKFAAARTLINYTNFGNMNIGAMNSYTYFKIISNTNIKGMINPSALVGDGTGGQTVTIPGLPGVSIILEESIANGTMYLLDKQKAILRKQGAIRTEQYRLEREGGNGLVYRDWNDVHVQDANKGVKITGLTS